MTVCPTETHVHVHIDGLVDHTAQLTRMEQMMATAAEQLDALNAKIEAQGTALTDLSADVIAMRDILESERENLSSDAQSKMDAVNANIDARNAQLADLDAAVGDADGSDVVPPVDPEA